MLRFRPYRGISACRVVLLGFVVDKLTLGRVYFLDYIGLPRHLSVFCGTNKETSSGHISAEAQYYSTTCMIESSPLIFSFRHEYA
jgi:hypothetical protein